MNAKLLSKLTAKGLVITGEGFGGEQSLTAQDVAQALSGLDRLPYLYALFKYVILFDLRSVRGNRSQDGKSVHIEYFDRMPLEHQGLAAELAGTLYEKIHVMYIDWYNVNEGSLYHATRTALWECIDPRFNNCKKCGGSGKNTWGTLTTGKPATDCKKCGGSGIVRKTASQYAKLIGIDKSNWARCWESRYEKIYRYVSDLDGVVIRHMQKKLEAA
jgi:hypothetical protein